MFKKSSLGRKALYDSAISAAIFLVACGGGGGGSAPTLVSQDIEVSPSLGQFSEGTVVELLTASGRMVAQNVVGKDGKSVLPSGGTSGPLVIRVKGSDTANFYDERTKLREKFGVGKSLSAVVPKVQGKVGVTALTNAAVKLLENTAKGLAGSTDADVLATNKQVAALFPDIADILTAPRLVNEDTKNSLDIAIPEDKYALLLAALAHTANGGTAVDVAEGLANDLKDGKLDGKDGATPLSSYLPNKIVAAFNTVAAQLATLTSQVLIANKPLVVVVEPVAVVVVKTNQQMAKEMFADLRTTKNVFVTSGKTGFLDTEAEAIGNQQTAQAPDLDKYTRRLEALYTAVSAFEKAKGIGSPSVQPFVSGVPLDGPLNLALMRTAGTESNAYFGGGDASQCYADTVTPAAVAKMTCVNSRWNGARNRLDVINVEITSPAANQYAYVVKQRVKPRTGFANFQPVFGAVFDVTQDGFGVPFDATGTGTLLKTVPGAELTKVQINGTLPPSRFTDAAGLLTGKDTIQIEGERLDPSPGVRRYMITGLVSTTKLGSANTLTEGFAAGSYIEGTTQPGLDAITATSGHLVLTVQTDAGDFAGVLDIGDFRTDKNGLNRKATRFVFDGNINDKRPGAAGVFLVGKLDVNFTAGYALYTSFVPGPETPNNFARASVSFTGKVQAPNRPLMSLALALNRSVFGEADVTLNYSYGTTSITGSGKVYNKPSANPDTFTVSNGEGVTWNANSVATQSTVVRSGELVATVKNGVVNYLDGTSETLE